MNVLNIDTYYLQVKRNISFLINFLCNVWLTFIALKFTGYKKYIIANRFSIRLVSKTRSEIIFLCVCVCCDDR